MTRSNIIMVKDCLLVVADVDSVIDALLGVTSWEDVLLESGRSLWCVSSFTVPSIDYPVLRSSHLNTKSNSLSCCSLPHNLGELQGGLLLSTRVRASSGEVVGLLSAVPFIRRRVRGEYLRATATFKLALSTASELGRSK